MIGVYITYKCAKCGLINTFEPDDDLDFDTRKNGGDYTELHDTCFECGTRHDIKLVCEKAQAWEVDEKAGV